MSVDISRLSAGLPPEQQKAVARVYRQRAKSPTTAFLLCFFLGIFGAHCFYLGKTGQGVLRLIISPLIIPGLIWEIIDLFRIDGEVYERNLKLGEQLVAEAMLAVPPAAAEQEAIRRLDEAIQEQEHAQAEPGAVAAVSPGAATAVAAATAPAAEALAAPAAPEEAHAADVETAYTPAATSYDTPVTSEASSAPEVPFWPVEAAAIAGVAALAAEQPAGDEQQRAAEEERLTAPWPAQAQEPAPPPSEYTEPAAAAPEWPAPATAEWATAAQPAAEPADAMAAEQAATDWGQAEDTNTGASAGSEAVWSASQTPGSGDAEPAEPAYLWPEARPLSPEPAESGPMWAKPPALMAEAGLAAAAASGESDTAAAAAEPVGPAESVAPAEPTLPQATAFEPAWPEQAAAVPAWQTPSDADLGYQQPAQSQPAQPDIFAAEAQPEAFATEPGPDDTWAAITPEAVAAAALAANQVAPLRRTPAFDVTDQAVEDGDPGYVADIGEGGPAGRVHVALPASQPAASPYAFDAAPPAELVAEEYVAAPSPAEMPAAAEPQPVSEDAEGTGETSSATLLLVPVAEALAEPVGPADTAAMDDLAGLAPSAAEPAHPEAVALAADAAPAAFQGPAEPPAGDYESHVTEEVHDQGGQGGRRVVKRVRVVRRLMVNGQVVQETSAEQVVDADADTAATAASLQQTLGTTDPETLARLAGTLPDNHFAQKVDQSGDSAAPGSSGQSGQLEGGGAGQGGA